MADIIYIWGRGQGSVGLAPGLELPQFKVVGHKILNKLEVLSTGKKTLNLYQVQILNGKTKIALI